eukprot:CAMPEP_0201507172 /NCGR_PEP_ID=MMETSP0161_2-20130828/921_1 /ASSEMBLY_ACC=CAM_ASM_000251 /TAXON_ID=180227 /ORGANISM="Neoparamoeba aestuarina, Strain SoJaBio B1-5/56/2" /LENGTH=202 /DNA_ID=CAMNT_0047901467 /DNA_START=51 /DNA_END=656 /DNA_ORIENTATION=-
MGYVTLYSISFALLVFLLIGDVLIPPTPPPPPSHKDTLARLPIHFVWQLPVLGQVLCTFVATCFALLPFLFVLSPSLLFSKPPLPPFQQRLGWWIGFGVGMMGWAFRMWAKEVLNENFTYQISKPTVLIQKQPYTYLVHPGYSGVIFHVVGLLTMGVVGSKLSGRLRKLSVIVFVMGGVIGALSVRILEEERMLEVLLGSVW